MVRIKSVLVLLLLIFLSQTASAKVVCTTTVLAGIVEDLTGEEVEIIASPSVCPAHYDIKPSDVDKVRDADIIFIHGMEPWVGELLNVSGSKAKVVKVPGPWNTPELLRQKYIAVAKALEEEGYSVSLKPSLDKINRTEKYLKEFAKKNGFVGTPVVCMQWQKNFVEFLGFNITVTYPPPEMVSAKKYEEIIEKGRGSKLVIDNLQSGTELGKKIAKDIGAKEVALSNFPADGNLTEMMIENAEKLAKALESERVESERQTPGFELVTGIAAAAVAALATRRD